YRLFDLAIDSKEDNILNENQIDWILSELAKHPQITAKLSSIHINYWYGEHTKVTAAEFLMKTHGEKLNVARENAVYCGDSPNDEPLFEFFENSVGVANIKPYLSELKFPPKFITREAEGAGFREVVSRLVSV